MSWLKHLADLAARGQHPICVRWCWAAQSRAPVEEHLLHVDLRKQYSPKWEMLPVTGQASTAACLGWRNQSKEKEMACSLAMPLGQENEQRVYSVCQPPGPEWNDLQKAQKTRSFQPVPGTQRQWANAHYFYFFWTHPMSQYVGRRGCGLTKFARMLWTWCGPR